MVGLPSSSIGFWDFPLLALHFPQGAFHFSPFSLHSSPQFSNPVPCFSTLHPPPRTSGATTAILPLFFCPFVSPVLSLGARNCKVSDVEKQLVTIKRNKECYIHLGKTEPFPRFCSQVSIRKNCGSINCVY